MVRQDLLGRSAELAEVDRWARTGMRRKAAPGRVLMVVGEAGIGKTAFLGAACRTFEELGNRVIRTVGVQAETQMPFAGLHQLLRTLTEQLPALPDAEAEAIRAAFGQGPGSRPEAAFINRGSALLLRMATRWRRINLVVDDAQWLDPQTREVLSFLVQRAPETGADLLIAQRSGWPELPGTAAWPSLTLSRLTDADSELLLRQTEPALTDQHRKRVLEQAAGHPLALRELARGSTDDGQGTAPLTERLERAFGSRGVSLPPATRALLLVAAADGSSDLDEIYRAAGLLNGTEIREEDLAPAVEANLVHQEEKTLLFRHPLVRSGVLEAETFARRRQAHLALAEAITDPYRHAWHRARAAWGYDDEAADLLADAAERVLDQGAVTAAVEALERSAELTAGRVSRGRRLLRAAELAFELGREELVTRLVDCALSQGLDTLDRARGQWLREIFSDGKPGDAPRVFELCAIAGEAAEAGDADLALNLLLGAGLRCWWADTGPAARAAVTAAADLLAETCTETRDDPRWLAVLAVAQPILRGSTVHAALDLLAPDQVDDAAALRLLGMSAHAIGHEVRAAAFLDRAEALLRNQGRVGSLAHVLSMQVSVRSVLGRWDEADAAAAEGLRLAEESQQPVWSAGTMVCHAQVRGLRGEAEEALATAARAEVTARNGRLNCLLSCVGTAKGLAWTAEGLDEDAYTVYRALFDPEDPSYHLRQSFDAVSLFAEAAVRTGNTAEGRAVLGRLEQVAQTTTAPLLHVQLPYSRAVLADDADAEELYKQARAVDLAHWPWLDARTRLAYGGWLLRGGRQEEAARELGGARDLLTALGAQAWVGRADLELAALT